MCFYSALRSGDVHEKGAWASAAGPGLLDIPLAFLFAVLMIGLDMLEVL